MLHRSRSYPGSLCQLQNSLCTDRNLAKLARHSNPHGLYVPPKLPRINAGIPDQQLPADKRSPSQSEKNSLTKINIASSSGSRRDFLTLRESTKQPAQVALVPASLMYKENSCSHLCLASTSQNIKLQREATLRGARELVVRERKDDSDCNNCVVHKDAHFSASDSFVRWQEGKADQFLSSTVDPLEKGSCQPHPTKGMKSGEGTKLLKVWKKKKEKRRMGGLILLNVLAALYGSSNVANGLVEDAAPSLPVSLTSLVRFTSALFFFAPALLSALKDRDIELLRAGAELGALSFAATVVDSCNPMSGSSSSAALLLAFTVIFIPIMELCAGRRSGCPSTRFAILAAISGMGLLEEEGFGWRGISCPQIGDLWGVAVSIISALHIFRSESHCGRFDPLLLNAVQCGVVAILSLGWETFTTFDASAFRAQDVLEQVQGLPWAPLIYNGVVCFGLCSWLEMHGLRSIHASTATLVYTTIPVWGAFLSYFAHHETPVESAMIGALVIMVTSIYAQLTTTKVDIPHLRHQENGSTSTSSNLKPDYQEGLSISESNCMAKERDDSTGDSKTTTHDYFPGALLISQLKFPYYAAQAKSLLVDVKIKLAAIKSIILTAVSNTIVTASTKTSTPGSPDVNPANGAAPSSHVNGANSLSGSPSNFSSATSHIAKVDVSTAQHIAPHGPNMVGPMSSSGTEVLSEALKTGHTSSDLTAIVVNVGTHFLAVVTTGLESTLIAVGSDIMFEYDEAVDATTSLERFVQVGVENSAHTVASCLSVGSTWLDITSSKVSQSAVYVLQELASRENIVSPSTSHVTTLTDLLLNNVLPLLHHIQ